MKRLAAFACLCALALVATASAGDFYPYAPTASDIALAAAATVHRSDLGRNSASWVLQPLKKRPAAYGCVGPFDDAKGLVVTGFSETAFNYHNTSPRVYSEGWVFKTAALNEANWKQTAAQAYWYAGCQRYRALTTVMSNTIIGPPKRLSFPRIGDHVFAYRFAVNSIPGTRPVHGFYDVIIMTHGRIRTSLINEMIFTNPPTAADLRVATPFDIRLMRQVRSRMKS